MKIKTFANLAKKVQVKQSDEKLETINADKSFWSSFDRFEYKEH